MTATSLASSLSSIFFLFSLGFSLTTFPVLGPIIASTCSFKVLVRTAPSANFKLVCLTTPNHLKSKEQKKMADSKEILESLGLTDQALEDTLLNQNLIDASTSIVEQIGGVEIANGLDAGVKKMLVDVSKIKGINHEQLGILANFVVDGSAGKPQISAAQAYFKKLKNKPFVLDDFKSVCGIGINYTDEQIKEEVIAILEENREQLEDKKWNFLSKLFGIVRQTNLKFADGAVLTSTLNEQVEAMIGPKTGKVVKEKPREKRKKIEDRLEANEVAVIQESIKFPDPAENEQVDPELLKKHLEETGGQIRTRFPPEPNGYLHIGHSKAMSLSFGYAKKKNGICFMRLDDTNPEAESTEYINAILENVKWLGHEWVKVTYSSDYFQELYEYAVELIKRGYAFVCHQTKEQIEFEREHKQPSPWRDRPIEENLREFERMKLGLYAEGEATLRMKMDYLSPNPSMWDHVAYRIKFVPHPHAGGDWCIYPSYDFTHCIVDSIENITHSLCTLEFESRHESYNWLLDVLGLYKPLVWEYGRLTLTHTLLSKRKLIKLVKGNYGLDGWDDPRLPTINGYRRRGYTPESFHSFCEDIGVTRKPDIVTPIEKFETFVREHLNATAVRVFGVLDPIKLVIENWEDGVIEVPCPNIPGKPELGEHNIPFSGTIYIEREDFKEKNIKGYFGLALDSEKWVRLKYSNTFVKLVDIIKDEEGNAVELRCVYEPENSDRKPSGTIHWVSEPAPGVEPLKVEYRLYDKLFMSENPGALGANWEKDLNPNSLVVKHGYADPTVAGLEIYDKAQFERVGYFCKDRTSTPDNLVFNLTVSLKESKWKKQKKQNK
eukprot:TRINITY_DN4558_c0_g1_i1.p1 TRINITY_DN4558_c0_g1~~TRINITY_DN4558_c0_g1_i1.p1  ORF type:complete len:835 (+),score=210.89 TRINITY_DN4558_c0_g1_i1:1691-4195(+)